MASPPPQLRPWLALAIVAYLAILFALAGLAQRRIKGAEDFVVAGRRLGPILATGTLLATWFGAGTLMTAADEVRARGLYAATLDPLGAGLCLLLAGFYLAPLLWREKLLTFPELFGRRYGSRERRLAAGLMVPTYLGWIAAQFCALAALLELYFEIPLSAGIALVATVGVTYTVVGGMWAVVLTDAVQITLTIFGLICVAFTVLTHLGDGSSAQGLQQLWRQSDAQALAWLPAGHHPTAQWLSVLAAGALGNLASQDLFQRISAARSARVAKLACVGAGLSYLTLGLIPVGLGLAGRVLWGPDADTTIPALAGLFLHPAAAIAFLVTLLSVVMSTIDSALLAPAVVVVRDLLGHTEDDAGQLTQMKLGVAGIGLIGCVLALIGENAYALLESSYELGMVALLAPLCFALAPRRFPPWSATLSMLAGTLAWTGHQLAGSSSFLGLGTAITTGLGCTALSFAAHALGFRYR